MTIHEKEKTWIISMILRALIVFFVGYNSLFAQAEPPHHWNSPSEVVKKVKANFSNLPGYSAEFKISINENKKSKQLAGKCYYKKPGKIRYNFSSPEGDTIVSDGKILWIYIKKSGAVGKQDLQIQRKNKSGSNLFTTQTPDGLSRLFRKYHYKFDNVEQPRSIDPQDPKKYFILSLEQREKIGGFEKMTLFIDASTYWISKTIASDGRGKESQLVFLNQRQEDDLEDGIFNYRPEGTTKIVNNPLVTDN
jgi:outer membrane lipoprotein-sorting protein